MILSSWSRPWIARCAPGRRRARCRRLATRLEQNIVDERRLARARDARHAREHAERDLHVDVAQVVLARAFDLHVAARRAPLRRRLDRARARQELTRQPSPSRVPPASRCPARRSARRARPRPGRCRRGGRPRASSARRARPRSPCCRGRAAARASRSASSCRAGAARSRARRGCTARPRARSRSASPGGSAAPRRRTGSRPRGPSTGSRSRRSPGTAAARRSPAGSAARRAGRSLTARPPRSHSSARRADSAQNSSIGVPPTSTARDSARSRAPPQTGQARSDMNCSIFSFVHSRVGLAVAALQVLDDPLEARRVGALCARSGCGR